MDDASCGPENALSKFSKQIHGESSSSSRLNDRLIGRQQGNAFQSRQHQGPPKDALMINEFLAGSSVGPNTVSKDPFNLSDIGRHLEMVQPPSSSYPLQQHPEDWASQFRHATPSHDLLPGDPDLAHFERAFQNHVEQHPGVKSQWAEEFRHAPQPPVVDLAPDIHAAFDQAYKNAIESASWENEFKNQHPQQSWTEEFQDQVDRAVTDVQNQPTALAETAGALLDAVKNTDNEKFKSSQFFKFMEKIRDQEVGIEGSKVVEQVRPSSLEWAQEFAGKNAINSSNWEEEFSATQGPSQNWAQEFSGQQQIPGANQQSWATEFEQKQNDNLLSDIPADDYDWANEFKTKMRDIYPQDTQDEAWEALEQQWKKARNADDYLAAIDPRFEEYAFTPRNPYLTGHSISQLEQMAKHANLTESILALEAIVQLDVTNAHAWRMLGLRQQENENEIPAIVSLKKSLKLEPGNLEALMALSVSYTNENYMHEAYQSLENWLAHHPVYHTLAAAPQDTANMGAMDRHAAVTGRFLNAATSRPGEDLDEDIQTALGILFNISSEYDKAVDCFQAALSKRPSDYLLWNKLGATLANSSQADKAVDAYFNALQINPSFMRARYNLSIACMHMGQYREAAEHLLVSLGLQQEHLEHVLGKTGKSSDVNPEWKIHATQSDTLWKALRTLMDTYIHRPDLAEACDKKDLQAFRGDFEF